MLIFEFAPGRPFLAVLEVMRNLAKNGMNRFDHAMQVSKIGHVVAAVHCTIRATTTKMVKYMGTYSVFMTFLVRSSQPTIPFLSVAPLGV